MKQKQWMKWTVLALFMMAAGVMLAGCGSSDHDDDAPAQTTQSGKVVQGIIAGARVFADLDGDRVWDSNEAFTFSDENGDFELTLPAGDYFIVSSGGTNLLTGNEAGTMSAPKDAKNITPLTDLVAQAGADSEAVKAIIEELGGGAGYDVDITQAEGISTDLMKLVKTVEGTQKIFKELGKGDADSQKAIAKNLAGALKAAKDEGKSSDDLLKGAVEGAVGKTIEDFSSVENTDFEVTEDNKDAFKAAASTMVDEVVVTVESATVDGVVVENQELQDAVDTSTDTATDTVKPLAKKVTITIDSYDILDALGYSIATEVDGVLTAPADQAEQVEISLSASNDFGTDMIYPDVTATLSIDDRESKRLAIFIISGLTVTVDAAGNIAVDDSEALLSVEGQNADGSAVATTDVAGPFDALVISGNSVTFDLAVVQDLLAEQVAADFATIGLAGDYSVTVKVTGAPALSHAMLIKTKLGVY
jgi:hypothetical protein